MSKRIVTILLALMLALTVSPVIFADFHQTAYEGFNGTEVPTEGWTYVEEAEAEREVFSKSIEDGALKLTTKLLVDPSTLNNDNYKNGNTNVNAKYSFSPVSGAVIVSFKVKRDKGTERSQDVLRAGGAANFRLFGGNLEARTKEIDDEIKNYKAVAEIPYDEYTKIKLLMDFDKQQISVYVNDSAEPVIDRHTFLAATPSLSWLQFGGVTKIAASSLWSEGNIWYDEIKVTQVNNYLTEQEGIILQEDFSKPLTYTVETPEKAGFTCAADTASGALVLSAEADAAAASEQGCPTPTVTIPFTEQSKRFNLEFDISKENATRSGDIYLRSGEDSLMRMRIFGGNLQYRNAANQYVSIGTDAIKSGKCRVKLDIDPQLQRIDVYINETMTTPELPFLSDVHTVNSVLLAGPAMLGANATECSITYDNLLLTEHGSEPVLFYRSDFQDVSDVSIDKETGTTSMHAASVKDGELKFTTTLESSASATAFTQRTAQIAIPAASGVFNLEFTLRSYQSERAQHILAVGTSTSYIAALRVFGSNLQRRVSGSDYPTVGTMTKGEDGALTANVKMVIDTVNKTYDIYVNNQLLDAGTQVAFTGMDTLNILTFGSTTRVAANITEAYTAISNILVYNKTHNGMMDNISSPGLDRSEADKISFDLSMFNFGETPHISAVIAALVSPDNRLEACSVADINLNQNEGALSGLTFTLPENTAGYKVKFFVWDGLDTIKPLKTIPVKPLDSYLS